MYTVYNIYIILKDISFNPRVVTQICSLIPQLSMIYINGKVVPAAQIHALPSLPPSSIVLEAGFALEPV
jgi:hypothetical protein